MADWKTKALSFLHEEERESDDDDGEDDEMEVEAEGAGGEPSAAAGSSAEPAAAGAEGPAGGAPAAATSQGTPKGLAPDASGEQDGGISPAEPAAAPPARKGTPAVPDEVALKFPDWDAKWAPADGAPRDFGVTLKEYEKNRETILGGPLSGADETKLTQKQLDARKREAEKRAERKKAVEEKLAAQRKVHEGKQRKIRAREAEKELARIDRDREKQVRALEREAARIALEEERSVKREELAREKYEKYQEMEDRRREKEAHSSFRRSWQERSTVDDERLPEVEIPAGISCTWDEEGVLDQGDLLMAWSFLATNGEAICSPSLSLKDLCGGLLVAERALDLTDVHVALLRVLLLNMDTEMGQEYVTQPRRGDLLTNLTWPYMASMYLEESAHRLHADDVKLGKLLADKEYCMLPPKAKLRLLTLLCDECLGVGKVKARFNNTKATDKEWEPKRRLPGGGVAEEGVDDTTIKSCQLLGTDRARNRYFACQDGTGEVWVLVQKVDQGMWKRCQDELAVPTVEGESDSDEELFEDLYAAEEEERAEEQKEQDAAQAVRKVIQETMSALPDPEPRPKKARRGVWCEDCKIKSANYGLPSGVGKRKRWCSTCSKKEGRNGVCAKDLQRIMAGNAASPSGSGSAAAGGEAAGYPNHSPPQDMDMEMEEETQPMPLEGTSPESAAAATPDGADSDPLRLRGAGPEGSVDPNAARQAAPAATEPAAAAGAAPEAGGGTGHGGKRIGAGRPTAAADASAFAAQAQSDAVAAGDTASLAAASGIVSGVGSNYTMPTGTGRDNGKPVLSRTIGAEEWAWYPSQSECAKALNLEAGPISKCCNGAQKTAHGFEFKFALEHHQPDMSLKVPYMKPSRPRYEPRLSEVVPLVTGGADLRDMDDVAELTEREPTEEKWYLYSGLKQINKLLHYLDQRGFRECPLHRKIYEHDDVALCREKWPLVVTDDDQDVESILEAIVQTVLAVDGGMDARESDVTGMRVDGEGGTKRLKLQGMSETVESWTSARRMGDAAETCQTDDRTVIDDLDGRAIWARFANTAWWPGRVFPLRLAPKNVLALRNAQPKDYHKLPVLQASDARYTKSHKGGGASTKKSSKKGSKKGSAKAEEPEEEEDDNSTEVTEEDIPEAGSEKVLVQFYETGDFAWCYLTKTENFWSSYRKISQKNTNPTKSFTRAARSARIARFEEERHQFKDAQQVVSTKMQRLVDTLEAISDGFAWDVCHQDAGLHRETWEDSLNAVWSGWKDSQARSGRGVRGGTRHSNPKDINDKVMVPCLQLLQTLIDAADVGVVTQSQASIVHPWWQWCVFRPAPVAVEELEEKKQPPPADVTTETEAPAAPDAAAGDTAAAGDGDADKAEVKQEMAAGSAMEVEVKEEQKQEEDEEVASAVPKKLTSQPKACEQCKKMHLGDFGSGRFCCQQCARKYADNAKQAEAAEAERERLDKVANPPESKDVVMAGVGECPQCISGSGKSVGHPGKHRTRPLDEEEISDLQAGGAPLLCEHCEEQHDGEYGSGRFCSKACAARFATRRYMHKFQLGGEEEGEEDDMQEVVRPQLTDICSTSSAAAFHLTLFMLAAVPPAVAMKEHAKLQKIAARKNGKRGARSEATAAAAVADTGKKRTSADGGGPASKKPKSRDTDAPIIALPTVPTSIVTEDFGLLATSLREPPPEKKEKKSSKSKPKAPGARASGRRRADVSYAEDEKDDFDL